MAEDFTVSFDPASLSEIARFYSFPVFLAEETQTALSQAGELVKNAAIANTWQTFSNPTGKLADSLYVVQDSPYEVQIGSALPYAARREFGFQDGVDSLGRRFPNDVAKPYMRPALEDNEQQVLQLVEDGAQRALNRLGNGG